MAISARHASGPQHLAPVPYAPELEELDPDETATTERLIETITKIQQTVYEDSGQARRGVHAKSHGVVTGEFTVVDGLPPELAQGLFAVPGRYPVVMRFSTIPGDMLADSISVPRGLALKVIGVKGARVVGSESDVTQDFVFANGPVFSKSNPKGFLSTLKLLASTTDKAPGMKKVLSSVSRGAEKIVESVGGQSATLMTLGGYPETHVLGDDFFSQAPILYGTYMAKIAMKPSSESLLALKKATVDVKHNPDALREAVVDYFRTHDGEWDLQVQLCTDLESMPIENPTIAWPEHESPYQTVARVVIPAQNAWSAERVRMVDERMSFSPWHALEAHRPLGAIMRVRKAVYEHAAAYRAQANKVPVAEPRSVSDLPN